MHNPPPSAQSMQSAKRALRQQILSVRAAMSASEKAQASEKICDQLLKMPELLQAKCVAGFHPMSDEVNIQPALEECRRMGKQVALPRICGPRQMTFHLVSAEDVGRLRTGPKNILEPSENLPLVSPQLFDFAIIPAVAIDSQLFRLGYGGGFYDTFMTQMDSGAVSCAAVFHCQRIMNVPTEAHDRRVCFAVSQ